ncbi:hypothetical protein VWT71_22280, partial [Xanthomonas citri pv. citri]
MRTRVVGERGQRGHREQEDDREGREKDVQSDLLCRLLLEKRVPYSTKPLFLSDYLTQYLNIALLFFPFSLPL